MNIAPGTVNSGDCCRTASPLVEQDGGHQTEALVLGVVEMADWYPPARQALLKQSYIYPIVGIDTVTVKLAHARINSNGACSPTTVGF